MGTDISDLVGRILGSGGDPRDQLEKQLDWGALADMTRDYTGEGHVPEFEYDDKGVFYVKMVSERENRHEMYVPVGIATDSTVTVMDRFSNKGY